jgi:nitroimidazol reductase NimA-like FMN-containing flavoprotein (pyridoxamine 5'-phosphate oxidase superfamily)
MADKDFEDVSMYTLAEEREAELLNRQNECTFIWRTSDGDPVGVIMNYVWADGRFWLTATRRRKRITAIERDPRVAIAISSRGTGIGTSQSLTYKGAAVLHDDDETKQWFYAALAAAVRPGEPDKQAAFVAHLDSPGRVVIEIVPSVRIGFDSQAMFRGSAAGPSRTELA